MNRRGSGGGRGRWTKALLAPNGQPAGIRPSRHPSQPLRRRRPPVGVAPPQRNRICRPCLCIRASDVPRAAVEAGRCREPPAGRLRPRCGGASSGQGRATKMWVAWGAEAAPRRADAGKRARERRFRRSLLFCREHACRRPGSTKMSRLVRDPPTPSCPRGEYDARCFRPGPCLRAPAPRAPAPPAPGRGGAGRSRRGYPAGPGDRSRRYASRGSGPTTAA